MASSVVGNRYSVVACHGSLINLIWVNGVFFALESKLGESGK